VHASPRRGADVFVFGARDGQDTITDLRVAKGDRIDLRATLLGWDALDSDDSSTTATPA
jgi:hypothetical protein